jgi:hypothetical protein
VVGDVYRTASFEHHLLPCQTYLEIPLLREDPLTQRTIPHFPGIRVFLHNVILNARLGFEYLITLGALKHLQTVHQPLMIFESIGVFEYFITVLQGKARFILRFILSGLLI